MHDRRGRRLERHPPRDPPGTERATEIGPDALLHVNPYYNRPSRRGIVRHYEEICRATDLPILLYNIPQRTGSDMSNDLLAELAQLDNIFGVPRLVDRALVAGDRRRGEDNGVAAMERDLAMVVVGHPSQR